MEQKLEVILIEKSNYIRSNLEINFSKFTEIEKTHCCFSVSDAKRVLKQNPKINLCIYDFLLENSSNLDFLEYLSQYWKIPVIILTGANRKEKSQYYNRCFTLGFNDFIQKKEGIDSLYFEEIVEEIHSRITYYFNQFNHNYHNLELVDDNNPIEKFKDINSKCEELNFKLIVIGASMGGPELILKIFSQIEFNSRKSFLIVQHMPEGFTNSFAKRLSEHSKYQINEIQQNMKLVSGKAYIIPGNYHAKLCKKDQQLFFEINKDSREYGVRPSIDYVLKSIACYLEKNCYLVILSGMGKDGNKATYDVKQHHGTVIIQDPSEATTLSMPQSALQTGNVDKVLTIDQMIIYLNNL